MESLSRSTAVLTALFAAIPTFIAFSFLTWELLLFVNNGIVLNSGQIFMALFTGFSFGLAAFSFVFAATMMEQ